MKKQKVCAVDFTSDFSQKKCVPCEGGVPALKKADVQKALKNLPGWKLRQDSKEISCDFKFKNYYQTMAFVNAIAWMAHHEDHHPDLEVGYNHCLVRYSTHAIGGLSENDLICASKVTRLLES
jgi:4a-hydroxytetrahydrobiopterin dehydratase